jgi:uncharacterized protein with WD repeat
LFSVTPFYSTPPPAFPDNRLEDCIKKIGSKPVSKTSEKKAAYIPPSKRGKDGQGAAQPAKAKPVPNSGGDGNSSSLTETEKKIRTAKKKLEQIDKMKQMIAEGKQLEKNQLEKMSKEQSLLDEIKALELSS